MKSLREAFQKAKMEIGDRGRRLADLMRMLRITIASLRRVFIRIDAYDEFLPRCLPELLESLRSFAGPLPQRYSSPGGTMPGQIFKDISQRRL